MGYSVIGNTRHFDCRVPSSNLGTPVQSKVLLIQQGTLNKLKQETDNMDFD